MEILGANELHKWSRGGEKVRRDEMKRNEWTNEWMNIVCLQEWLWTWWFPSCHSKYFWQWCWSDQLNRCERISSSRDHFLTPIDHRLMLFPNHHETWQVIVFGRLDSHFRMLKVVCLNNATMRAIRLHVRQIFNHSFRVYIYGRKDERKKEMISDT